jgi:hypothetical protein
MVYMPSARAITINMTQLSGSATARWFDPTTGTFTTVSGSPLMNTSTALMLSPPSGNHTDGYSDWVLVLETNPP